MRNHIRYPLIVAIILLLSILLLPGISATRKGIKPTGNDKSSWDHNLVRAGRFLIASLQEPDDEDPPFADLIVNKTASSEQVAAGSDLTYTIEVRNGGPEVAADVTMSDPLPPGMTFVSLTKPAGWTCSTPAVGDGGTVTCTNASLAVTSGDVFTLVVNVPSEVEPGTFFSNTASVSTTSLDPNDENNRYTAVVMVPAAGSVNVGVTKTASSEKVAAGSDLTYTIEVRNSGPEAADNVTLSDTLPGNMTFVSVTEPAGWTCSTPAVGDGGTVTCTNPSLAVTSGDLFTLVGHIPSDTSLGTIYTNTATVSTTTPDYNSEDDSSTVSTEIASADLSVTKVDAPDPVTAGDNLTYTITVNNAGPSAASVSLSDTLPANTSFVSISAPGGWFCNSPAVGAGGTVSCSNPELDKGSAVFTLTVATSPALTAGTIVSNTATVSSATPDPNPGNESSTATTTLLSPATLSGTKTVNGQFTPGNSVSYTVVITNNGPAAQGDNPGNEFTDVLPASLTLVSATATSGTATIGANTVAWNGSVPKAGSVTITIQATIKSGTEETTISNQGTISYDTDGNGTNETSALTDDPSVAGSNDPTTFVVHAAPTLSINNVSVTEGNSGTKDATFTVTLSASSSQAVTVDYQTANGTATAVSDYQSTSGTLTFAPGDITKTVTVLINGDTVNESDETFTVNLSNPQNATLASTNVGTGTILNDDSPGVQLGSDSYTVSEGASHFTITVARTGDLSGAASVDYLTSDLSGLNNCDVVTGNASQRCDYTAVAGTLNFIAGQSSATFEIPVIDDVYVEGPETFTLTLSNPTAGSNLGTPSTATLTITDNDASPGAPNPIDDDTFFIRQQYLDILGREPDAPGLAGWLDFLHSCTANSTACDRVELSSRFFRSAEFFDRAYFIYRFYETALGRKPTYDEYQSDFAKVAGFLTSAELETRKAAFAEEFSQRPEFRAKYDSKADGDEYVNAIVATAGVEPSNRTSVASRQGALVITRGQALRELLESPEISARFFNEAFVVVGYFAYLRRDPDAQYLVWLNQLNTTGDYREMIRGFMQSPEYRSRFGPVAP